MGTVFLQTFIGEQSDFVAEFCRSEAVGNINSGFVSDELVETFINLAFRQGIQSGGRFVQNHHVPVLV